MSMSSIRVRLLCSFYGVGYSLPSTDTDASTLIDRSQTTEYDFGQGVNAGDEVWNRSSALVASSTVTFDFATVIANAFGQLMDLASIKAIQIINTGSTQLTLGGTCRGVAAVTLDPNGVYFVSTPAATGYTATGGTAAGTITITNVSGSAAGAYSIAIVAVSK
jgi:hypothetical protein